MLELGVHWYSSHLDYFFRSLLVSSSQFISNSDEPVRVGDKLEIKFWRSEIKDCIAEQNPDKIWSLSPGELQTPGSSFGVYSGVF